MKLCFLKELSPKETRISLIPAVAKKFVGLGADVVIESGFGGDLFSDQDFVDVGVSVESDRSKALGDADILVRVSKPDVSEVSQLKSGALHISYLDPFMDEFNILEAFAGAGVSAVSMEMIPRTTRAQKMDVLSSQASLAGYSAVIVAARALNKVFPMMMTPAGTISPSKVFVIGAGVAGLQAIATAKRLGARVEAFDTRPVVKEQVESLGAKFLQIDLKTEQTKDGYAKELTPEQIEQQRQQMAVFCSKADVVITTAQVFGRKAPLIVTNDMVDGMASGSVVVDLAVSTGGNVECAKEDETVDRNGVQVIGIGNMPGEVALHASQMFASNVYNLLEEYWDKDSKQFVMDLKDDILEGCVLTHSGEVVHERFKKG